MGYYYYMPNESGRLRVQRSLASSDWYEYEFSTTRIQAEYYVIERVYTTQYLQSDKYYTILHRMIHLTVNNRYLE